MPNNDYILRDGAINALTVSALLRNLDSGEDGTAHGYKRAAERIIAGVPAADVEPVRHGRWEDRKVWVDYDNTSRDTAWCSQCRNIVDMDAACLMKYCPVCGAQMEQFHENV